VKKPAQIKQSRDLKADSSGFCEAVLDSAASYSDRVTSWNKSRVCYKPSLWWPSWTASSWPSRICWAATETCWSSCCICSSTNPTPSFSHPVC